MRVLPIISNKANSFKKNNSQTRLERNNISQNPPKAHKYSGCPSADLAYVSMFDKEIARDLKLMGLI